MTFYHYAKWLCLFFAGDGLLLLLFRPIYLAWEQGDTQNVLLVVIALLLFALFFQREEKP